MVNNNKCGVHVMKNLIAHILTPKSAAQVHSLYLKQCTIRQGHKESLEDYTTKTVQFKSNLKGTNRCITNEELVRKQCQGLSNKLTSINTAIDDLQVHLP